jgi:hypothetical protein
MWWFVAGVYDVKTEQDLGLAAILQFGGGQVLVHGNFSLSVRMDGLD